MKGQNTISQENLIYFYARKLPHMFDTNKPIFITYRLKFTLPKSIAEELNKRRTDFYAEYRTLTDSEKITFQITKDEAFFIWFDELIAKSDETPQLLNKPELMEIVSQAYHFLDNKHYELLAYCIMPNHVHVLIYPIVQPDGNIYSPAHITYSWKRFTANQINKVLNQTGSLWQQESYDHLVRDEKELYHVLEYIIDNPVNAKLVNKWDGWKGTWIREDLKPSV